MESFGRSWVAICLTVLTGFTVEGHSIAKRNVFQLCDLMQYYTGISCVLYLNYGCYCGKGQVAATPRDEVDRCCQIHDDCYGMVDNGGYCWLKSIHVFYWSTCSGTECTCPSWPWTCSQKVCECDRDFAKCLTTAGYNETYADYDREKHCVDY